MTISQPSPVPDQGSAITHVSKTPSVPPQLTPEQIREPSRGETEVSDVSGPDFIYIQDGDAEYDEDFIPEGETAVSSVQEVDGDSKPRLQRAKVQRRSKKTFGLE